MINHLLLVLFKNSPLPIVSSFHPCLTFGSFLLAALGALALFLLPALMLGTLPLLPVDLRLPDQAGQEVHDSLRCKRQGGEESSRLFV